MQTENAYEHNDSQRLSVVDSHSLRPVRELKGPWRLITHTIRTRVIAGFPGPFGFARVILMGEVSDTCPAQKTAHLSLVDLIISASGYDRVRNPPSVWQAAVFVVDFWNPHDTRTQKQASASSF